MEYKPSKLPQFLGAVQDKFDERDFSFGAVVVPVEIPSWETGFDCEDKFGKLMDDDQKSTYRCVTEGGTNDGEMTFLAHDQNDKLHFSRKFVYPEIVLQGGGAQPRDFYKFWNKTGLCEEYLLPSFKLNGDLDETWAETKGTITKEILDNAAKHKIDSYYSIEPNDWDLVRQAIFQNAGCGSGFRGVNASMGHFIFLKGWTMRGGYKALIYKDSYDPFTKLIINKNGKFHLENPNGAEIILFSVWTAIKNFPQKKSMNVDENLLTRLYKLIFHRTLDEGAKKHLGIDLNLVLNAIESSGEWKFVDIVVKFIKALKAPLQIFGKLFGKK